MLEREEQHRFSLRAAGRVERYHTFPTIHRQTVAEHTWQVLRIWFELFNEPSTLVTVNILLHDAGEILTGDIPHATKRDDDVLRKRLAELEAKHVSTMVALKRGTTYYQIPLLRERDRQRIRICNVLEMAEFSCDEIILGNRGGLTILYNTEDALAEILTNHHLEDEDRVRAKKHLLRIFALCGVEPEVIK